MPARDASTLERPESKPLAVVVPRYTFEVVSEVDHGRRFVFEPVTLARVRLGRATANDFRLDDPLVSLRHAAFDFANGKLRLTDLDSKNGTFVEGVRIVSAYLSGGETIRVGDTRVKLDLAIPKTTVTFSNVTRFGRVLGSSPVMRGLYTQCERFALEDHPVLVEGEIGTGKELLAEALHEVGPRASGPFVVFDCAAYSEEAARAILFGDPRATAPLGALAAGALEPALFGQAEGGTFLFDEITELPRALQFDVANVVREGAFTPTGGVRRKIDVRFLATTRRDFEAALESRTIDDAIYEVFERRRLELPPLRQRGDDIEMLAAHFWSAFGAGPVPADFIRMAKEYAWPGNVQELVHAVARRVAGSDPPASPKDEADIIGAVIRDDLAFPEARRRVLDAFERRYLKWMLGKHGGNVSRAAAAAGIARRYFYAVRARTEK